MSVRKRRRRKWAIPNDVIVGPLNRMIESSGRCADSWTTYQWEQIRHECGAEYAGVPLDDVRAQGITCRKQNLTRKVNGHGPPAAVPLSEEYKKALASQEFRAYFAKVLEWFDYKCAVCNAEGSLDPHHRTYERLGAEKRMDCIPVCRKCHKVCDNRRRCQAAGGNRQPMLPL